MVAGAIRHMDVPGYYYLDFSTQEVTQHCFNAVEESQFVLLSGPRASGSQHGWTYLPTNWRRRAMKLSSMLRLNPLFFYSWLPSIRVNFQHISPEDSLESFWDTFSFSLSNKISSPHDFLQYFHCRKGEPASVVLIIDEVSSIHRVQTNVRDSFLNVFRAIRNTDGIYTIRSIIAAGNFNIACLSTSDNFSPFNSGIHIQNSNFTLEEVGRLFHEFAKDHKIQIGDDIVEDVFDKTNGYVSQSSWDWYECWV